MNNNVYLLHHLVDRSAARTPAAPALKHGNTELSYAELAAAQDGFAAGLLAAGIYRGDRVGIYLSKNFEHVAAAFGSCKAGACFVPINPVLKPAQVAHILNDCGVRLLITSPERLQSLLEVLPQCRSVERVVLCGAARAAVPRSAGAPALCGWNDFIAARPPLPDVYRIARSDIDVAAILYTSGSTGKPKGVVISHRNLVTGAMSVASYLGNHAGDRLLAVLPLSFDAGFSQLTTAFSAGACVVLLDYLTPMDVIRTLARERITGLTAVPPLYIQLAELDWPREIDQHLRYFANTGGKMVREVLDRLRRRVPSAQPFLMYGLTEAFRSTYLPPSEVDRRPDSIGRAIPNQEVLVLRPDGSRCDPGEPGELVHRGSTVALGYWGDPVKTAERFRPLPRGEGSGLVLTETAVFSGDTVRADAEGYLYFIGRKDEMIKSSGYRISPVEVEDAVYTTGLVAEAAALGLPDERLGQTVGLVVLPSAGLPSADADRLRELLMQALRRSLPPYMLPQRIEVCRESLPRNGNGKIDRKRLAQALAEDGKLDAVFASEAPAQAVAA